MTRIPLLFLNCAGVFPDQFSITVVAPHFPGSPTSELLDGINVLRFRYFFEPLERLAYGRGGGILARIRRNPTWSLMVPCMFVGQLLTAIRLLRREKFDLIHAHWLVPQGLSAIIARKLAGRRVPLIATAHGGDLYGLRGPVMDQIRGFVLRDSAAVTVVSHAMVRDIAKTGVSIKKIHVIPMGTDLIHQFCPGETPRNPKQVLFVGRLVEKKGCRYLIEAWPTVIKGDPAAKLSIVGDGPERYELERRVAELKVEESIRFLGSTGSNIIAGAVSLVSGGGVSVRGGQGRG